MPTPRWTFALVVAFVSYAFWSAPAAADPPWKRITQGRRVAADPNDDYPLEDVNGPWVIMATSFTGLDAEANARSLVHEFRKEHGWAAFTHRMDFDYTGQVNARGIDRHGEPRTMHYSRRGRDVEVAVLVGEFPAVDDADARKTLDKIKTLQPECLRQSAADDRPLTELRDEQRKINSQQLNLDVGKFAKKLIVRNNRQGKGPMAHAFVTTNPLLDRDFYVPPGLEPFVVELNKKVEHSLLNCPGRYSVRVATFHGRVVIDPKQIKQIEEQDDLDSRLEQAADKAHQLTAALRAKGYEAYEFHDRYSSLVTVGSFDSVGEPRADGKTEINPKVFKIMEVFGAPKQVDVIGRVAGVGNAKRVAGIALDFQPVPVEVPRATIGNRLDRGALGMR